MPSIVRSIHTLRTALRSPGSLMVDLLVVAAVVSLIGGLIAYGQQFGARFSEKANISLAWTALPLYTFFSLCRGLGAYVVSLIFTLLFATAAARSARSERVMLPILDVLQSIPVLGFLPGLVLGLAGAVSGAGNWPGDRVHHHDIHRAGVEHDVFVLTPA